MGGWPPGRRETLKRVVPKPGHTFYRITQGHFYKYRFPSPVLDTGIRLFRHTVQIAGILSTPGNSFQLAQHQSEDPCAVAIASGDPLSFSAGLLCPLVGSSGWLVKYSYQCFYRWEKTKTWVMENVTSFGKVSLVPWLWMHVASRTVMVSVRPMLSMDVHLHR